MYKKEIVINHFNKVSKKYDINNEKLYWKISDDLLWSIIIKYIPTDREIKILDIGGGTGEIALKILSKYPNVSYVIIDISKEMLNVARKKLSNFNDRVVLIHSDIDEYESSEKFDIVLNIYVLPFYHDMKKLISIVSNYLKLGGNSISVSENYYNALSLIALKGNVSELEELQKTNYGTLSSFVPKLRFDIIEDLLNTHFNLGLKPIFHCGYPVVSLIGVNESLSSEKESINKILKNNYDNMIKIEKKYIFEQKLIDRGKYLCVIGEKK